MSVKNVAVGLEINGFLLFFLSKTIKMIRKKTSCFVWLQLATGVGTSTPILKRTMWMGIKFGACAKFKFKFHFVLSSNTIRIIYISHQNTTFTINNLIDLINKIIN